MTTPVFDFVKKYCSSDPLRVHMPGHKGKKLLGPEEMDITEIDGADVLYHEEGILAESQKNASLLFDSRKTLYSTEGATLAIRAMLVLAKYHAKESGRDFVLAAGRNAHKSFLTGCALLDIDPIWIESENPTSLLTFTLSPEILDRFFHDQQIKPSAVYLTSPDYLGNLLEINPLAEVCHKHGALLLVDNAHGAYLQFLPEPQHPLRLGADLVCDSAHKTLPVLTGGAYLHISHHAPTVLDSYAENALALFASTSPSYLILQSLDFCNFYLSADYKKELYVFSSEVFALKKKLRSKGFSLVGCEPLKITIRSKSYGYDGFALNEILKAQGICLEFYDHDYVVMMLTPELGLESLKMIESVLCSIRENDPILTFPPIIPKADRVLSPREALFSSSRSLPISECEGKILAQPCITCPPAVPIAICGERISKKHIEAFSYYGIESLTVVK